MVVDFQCIYFACASMLIWCILAIYLLHRLSANQAIFCDAVFEFFDLKSFAATYVKIYAKADRLGCLAT
jgi:hypothetical protein